MKGRPDYDDPAEEENRQANARAWLERRLAAETAKKETEQGRPMLATHATLDKLVDIMLGYADRIAELERTRDTQATGMQELERVCNAQADEIEALESRLEAAEVQATGAAAKAHAALHAVIASEAEDGAALKAAGDSDTDDESTVDAAADNDDTDPDGDEDFGRQHGRDNNTIHSADLIGAGGSVEIDPGGVVIRADADAKERASTAYDATYLRAVHEGKSVDEATAIAGKASDDAMLDALGAREVRS